MGINSEALLFVILLGLIVFCLSIGIVVLLKRTKKLTHQVADLKKTNRELELQVHPLELQTIQSKLNPHLFKNVLNSIQSHAYQTYYSLDKLANVLDYVLYESDQKMVTLKEEIDFILNLIEINRIKLSPLFDLNIKNKIQENDKWYQEKVIVPLISVDLIENAFKHSDLRSDDAFISIVMELVEDHFVLTVSNKISPTPALKKQKGGIGNQNFKKRLDIVYKNHYKLEQAAKDDVYLSRLKINLGGYKTEMCSTGR